jgi:hypothetical protein
MMDEESSSKLVLVLVDLACHMPCRQFAFELHLYFILYVCIVDVVDGGHTCHLLSGGGHFIVHLLSTCEVLEYMVLVGHGLMLCMDMLLVWTICDCYICGACSILGDYIYIYVCVLSIYVLNCRAASISKKK